MISQDDESPFWVPFEPASCRNDLEAANDGGPLELQIRQQMDRMYWPRMVQRTRGKGNGNKEAA